jgi:uncharacterized protein (DUF58 family)
MERIDEEALAALPFAALLGIGGWRHALVLSLLGALGLLGDGALYLWQRHCLSRLSYRRRFAQHRAAFGEEVAVEVELVNDKLLPLSFLRVAELLPGGLEVRGATTRRRDSNTADAKEIVFGCALMPFERARRTVVLNCVRRGRHRFGEVDLTSGDPLGIRERTMSVAGGEELVVYPKVFSLQPPPLPARSPLGERRASRLLLEDPTRVAGMRQYREGDSLRHVDWRATARTGELLVRDFEPSAAVRVAIFFEMEPGDDAPVVERREFTLSLAASLLVHYSQSGIPAGCYAPGLCEGLPLAHDPTGAAGSLGAMLDLLAVAEPDPRGDLAGLLAQRADSLSSSVIAIVITSSVSPALQEAIASCRRRASLVVLGTTELATAALDRRQLDALWQVEAPGDLLSATELHIVH